MPNGAGAAAAGAGAGWQAIKASGAVVQVDPEDFKQILSRSDSPLVLFAKGGWLTPKYQYLTSYKGLAFFTKSQTELMLPGSAEIISTKKIWVPA